MRRNRFAQRATGFTLVESLIVMVFVAMLIVLGIPALQQMIHRSRLEGAARETAVMCQATRFEAIKSSTPTGIRFNPSESRIISWVDNNANGVVDDGERELTNRRFATPVSFGTPEGDALVGFQTDGDGAWITFNTDGSIVLKNTDTCEVDGFSGHGCMRLTDQRPNYIQLSIGPIATANVELRKWDGSEWVLAGQEGKPWKWE